MTYEKKGLATLTHEIVKWQAETFPGATVHGATEHLRREADELWHEFWMRSQHGFDHHKREVYDVENAREECADIFFMLVQLSTLLDFRLDDVVSEKLAKNKARKWKTPDEMGVVEHDEEA